jgi:hypothetical protein
MSARVCLLGSTAALMLDLGVVHLRDMATEARGAVVERAAGQALVTNFRWVAVFSALRNTCGPRGGSAGRGGTRMPRRRR